MKEKLKKRLCICVMGKMSKEYAKYCSKAIENYLDFMLEREEFLLLSEEQKIEMIEKYLKVPPQWVLISKEGVLYHEEMKHNESHLVGLKRFAKERYEHRKDPDLKRILSQERRNSEMKITDELLTYFQAHHYTLYRIWLNKERCDTYCKIYQGKGEFSKRDTACQLFEEEFLHANGAVQIEDTFYRMIGIPKQEMRKVK